MSITTGFYKLSWIDSQSANSPMPPPIVGFLWDERPLDQRRPAPSTSAPGNADGDEHNFNRKTLLTALAEGPSCMFISRFRSSRSTVVELGSPANGVLGLTVEEKRPPAMLPG